jgi:iron complex transport system substrate-binding protein
MFKRFSLLILWCFILGAYFIPVSSHHQTPGIEFSELKTDIRYAKGFTVEYFENYKVLKIMRPWRKADKIFTYVLVERGTEAPGTISDAQVIEVPVRNIASVAATHLAYLSELEKLDQLVAIGNTKYINNESVRNAIEAGNVQEVGNGPDINIEKMLAINPEVVTTFAMGKDTKDDYQQLMAKGIKTIIFSDYMEETPLGRAEWLKCMALFFNEEARAEELFSQVEKQYLNLKSKADSVVERPSVLLGFEINGKWNMPGGKSHQATYIADAGGSYLWKEDESSGRIPLTFEIVLEKGVEAEYWFDQSLSWTEASHITDADPRYTNIKAYKDNRVFNNNASLGPGGGNLYNETGIVHPDRILADLISILHPEILPDHQLVYYRHLDITGN